MLMPLQSPDVAVFLMSLHMCLQIFPPTSSTLLGSDGLYNIRRWVIAAWILVPNLMTALAFVNPGHAFVTTGAFCTLPIRPIWYRLALSWIPRYIIWAFIMGVAVRIYMYVGSEFKVFGQVQERSSSLSPKTSTNPGLADVLSTAGKRCSVAAAVGVEKGTDGVAPDEAIAWTPKKTVADEANGGPIPVTAVLAVLSQREPPSVMGPQSRPWSLLSPDWQPQKASSSQEASSSSSRRGSRQMAPGVLAEDFASLSPGYDYSQHCGSITTTGSTQSPTDTQSSALQSIRETGLQTAADAALSNQERINENNTLPIARRRAIQRQLRLLFIYPVIYMVMWIIPFVVNCLNYGDYFAQHPIFVLSAISTFCQTFMGFTDVAVFCWREKPWSHIPGSDGSFAGSFFFWRFCARGDWKERRASRAPHCFSGGLGEPGEQAIMAEEEEEAKGGEKSQSRTGLLSRGVLTPRSSPLKPTSASPGPLSVVRPHHRTRRGGSDRRHMEFERAQERLALERVDWAAKHQIIQEKRASAISMRADGSGSLQKEWWDGLEEELGDGGDGSPQKGAGV